MLTFPTKHHITMANKRILAVTLSAALALVPQITTATQHYTVCKNTATEILQSSTTAAKPFKGTWTATGNGFEAKAELDLYGMTVNGTDADYNDIKCYGMIHVGYGDRVDDCSITACKPNGNKAGITFVSSRDGHLYTATLTVDPAKNTLTVSNVTLADGSEFGDCYVNDGLVLKKK